MAEAFQREFDSDWRVYPQDMTHLEENLDILRSKTQSKKPNFRLFRQQIEDMVDLGYTARKYDEAKLDFEEGQLLSSLEKEKIEEEELENPKPPSPVLEISPR